MRRLILKNKKVNKIKLLYLLTFTVAFCSIAYELVLGQALSLFLGNTILRFSVTIGIYMFAMGIGAMIAEGKVAEFKERSFMAIETSLMLVGGFAPIFLFLAHAVLGGGTIFLIFALLLIALIGLLTGFEIPLLMELAAEEKNKKSDEGNVLGVDYLGAFVGSLVFALLFYPKFGLLETAFFVGFLNCVVGIIFYLNWGNKKKEEKSIPKMFATQVVLFFVFIAIFIFSENINELMINLYLK